MSKIPKREKPILSGEDAERFLESEKRVNEKLKELVELKKKQRERVK